ncbi:MAG: TlpA family protein disulfide reductase [Halobacteriaceae archaeon]
MNRRRVLSVLAGLGLTGGSAWVAQNRLTAADGASDALPVRLETLGAPGSSAGHVTVPRPGRPTLVDVFATWCGPCGEQMDALTSVHDAYDGAAAFVSVTNEPASDEAAREHVRDWWRAHDGAWTVGLDADADLTAALGASSLPFLALTDGTGAVRWTHAGVADEATLRTRLDALD